MKGYTKVDVLKRSVESICSLIGDHIKEHEVTMNEDEEPRDFMDMFIRKIRAEKGKTMRYICLGRR